MPLPPLILLILAVSGVYCDSHSLRCYETAVSSLESGLPLYSVAVYVDDTFIVNYTSSARRYIGKVEWIKKLENEFREKELHRTLENQYHYERHLQQVMRRFNDTKGFHVYQWMYGCDLRDDGSFAVYLQEGYDGRDYMYLDTRRRIYVPSMNEAQITTEKLNMPEVRLGEKNAFDLETTCIAHLKRFLSLGKEVLEKKVTPEVKVWGRESDGVTTLHCLVYGFYPRPVEVMWVRNGEDHMISLEAKTILPHPDGTYQTKASVEVPTREGDSYSCHVDHSSLDEPLNVHWDRSAGTRGRSGFISALVVLGSVLSIVGAGAALFLYRRRSGLTA